MTNTFEIYPGKNKKFFWRLRAANRLVVADGSQGYASRGNALRGARRVLRTLQRQILTKFKNVAK